MAQYVTVDTELPSGGNGSYDHPVNGVLWAALAEKAYVEAIGAGFVSSKNPYHNAYAALVTNPDGSPAGADPTWALQAITGQSASDNPVDVASAWNAGKLIVLSTSTPTSPYIEGSHCYAVVGYNPSVNLPFEVYNPWGTDSSGWAPGYSNNKYGLFNANGAFLSQNFASQSVGVGAAPGGPLGRNNTADDIRAIFAGPAANVGLFNDRSDNDSSRFGPPNAGVVPVSGGAIKGDQPQEGVVIGAGLSAEDRGSLGSGAFDDASSFPALADVLGTRDQANGFLRIGGGI